MRHFAIEEKLRLPVQGDRFPDALSDAGGAGEEEQEREDEGNGFFMGGASLIGFKVQKTVTLIGERTFAALGGTAVLVVAHHQLHGGAVPGAEGGVKHHAAVLQMLVGDVVAIHALGEDSGSGTNLLRFVVLAAVVFRLNGTENGSGTDHKEYEQTGQKLFQKTHESSSLEKVDFLRFSIRQFAEMSTNLKFQPEKTTQPEVCKGEKEGGQAFFACPPCCSRG